MPRSIDEPRPCRGTNPGVILARRDDSRPPSVVRGPWRAEIPACRLRACSGSLSAVPSPRRFTILNPRPSYQTIVANRLAAFRLQRLDDSEQPYGDGATREGGLFSQDQEPGMNPKSKGKALPIGRILCRRKKPGSSS